MYHAAPNDHSFRPAHDLTHSLHNHHVANPQELLNADRHRVVLLTLEPGDSLPEQLHLSASKTLVVMEGCAAIMRDNAASLLHEGASATLPPCTRHRIVNTGKIPLRMLDIRSGACVEDDDRAA